MKIISLLFLILLTTSVFASEILKEGHTRIYKSDKGYNILKLVSVSDIQNKAQVDLNGEKAIIKEDERHFFKDTNEIYIRSILKNNDNKDAIEYFILIRNWHNISINISEIKTSSLNISIQENITDFPKPINKTLINNSDLIQPKQNFFEKIIIFFKKIFKFQISFLSYQH